VQGLVERTLHFCDVFQQQPLKEPLLPDLFKDEEHCNLISDVSIQHLIFILICSMML